MDEQMLIDVENVSPQATIEVPPVKQPTSNKEGHKRKERPITAAEMDAKLANFKQEIGLEMDMKLVQLVEQMGAEMSNQLGKLWDKLEPLVVSHADLVGKFKNALIEYEERDLGIEKPLEENMANLAVNNEEQEEQDQQEEEVDNQGYDDDQVSLCEDDDPLEGHIPPLVGGGQNLANPQGKNGGQNQAPNPQNRGGPNLANPQGNGGQNQQNNPQNRGGPNLANGNADRRNDRGSAHFPRGNGRPREGHNGPNNLRYNRPRHPGRVNFLMRQLERELYGSRGGGNHSNGGGRGPSGSGGHFRGGNYGNGGGQGSSNGGGSGNRFGHRGYGRGGGSSRGRNF